MKLSIQGGADKLRLLVERLTQSGPTTRTPAQQRRYNRLMKQRGKRPPGECGFCQIGNNPDEAIAETANHFWIVENAFPYAVWDDCGVQEHLMIVPKSHRLQMSDFTEAERAEWFEICAKYDSHGYSRFSRGTGSAVRSVAHQHTHLILQDNERKHGLLFLFRPHILVTWRRRRTSS